MLAALRAKNILVLGEEGLRMVLEPIRHLLKRPTAQVRPDWIRVVKQRVGLLALARIPPALEDAKTLRERLVAEIVEQWRQRVVATLKNEQRARPLGRTRLVGAHTRRRRLAFAYFLEVGINALGKVAADWMALSRVAHARRNEAERGKHGANLLSEGANRGRARSRVGGAIEHAERVGSVEREGAAREWQIVGVRLAKRPHAGQHRR